MSDSMVVSLHCFGASTDITHHGGCVHVAQEATHTAHGVRKAMREEGGAGVSKDPSKAHLQ